MYRSWISFSHGFVAASFWRHARFSSSFNLIIVLTQKIMDGHPAFYFCNKTTYFLKIPSENVRIQVDSVSQDVTRFLIQINWDLKLETMHLYCILRCSKLEAPFDSKCCKPRPTYFLDLTCLSQENEIERLNDCCCYIVSTPAVHHRQLQPCSQVAFSLAWPSWLTAMCCSRY